MVEPGAPAPLLRRLSALYGAGFTGLDRRVLLLAAAYLLVVAARMSLVTFLAIHLVDTHGMVVAVVGLAFLAENAASAVSAPFGGALSDRVGRRPVLLAGVAAFTLLLPTVALVTTLPALLAWSLAIGVAQGVYRPSAIALLLDLVPAHRRQSALALNYTAIALGYTVGVAPAGFLAAWSFTALAVASGVLSAIVLVVLAGALRGELPREERAPGAAPASFLRDAMSAFRDAAFLRLAALAFLFPVGLGLATIALPVYAADAGIGRDVIGLVLSVNGLGLAVLSVPVNARLEAGGPYRLLPVAAPFLALAYAAFAFAPTPLGLLLGLVAFTFGEVLFASTLPTAVAGLAPPGARGAYQGAWGMVFSLGAGSALFLGGLVSGLIGWRGAWIEFALVTLLAGVGLALARAGFRREADARAGGAVPPAPEPPVA